MNRPPLGSRKNGQGTSAGVKAEKARVLQVLEDYMKKLEEGVPPHPEELLARHPEIRDELRAYLKSLDFLHRAALSLRDSEATGEAVSEGLALEATQLGDYRIIREIGRGGMAIVYQAEQISLSRTVALKVLPFAAVLDQRQLQRFKNEAQAAAQLHHTNIVSVHSVGCERGVHYYAMEYIEGQTLAEVIGELRELCGLEQPARPGDPADTECEPTRAEATPTPLEELTSRGFIKSREFCRTVARLGIQAAEALEHAHEAGVVHRDVKPSNLLLDARANLRITDFGLARCRTDPGLTLSGELLGTLRYMSPEQALGKRILVDERTDIYSLGVTLYELLTLEPAYKGRDREEILRQIAFEEPPSPRRVNRAIPVELETIVLKAMEKNPENRYATAKELAEDLRCFLEDRPIQARRPTLFQRAAKWSRRHRALVWSAAALLLMATVGSSVSTVLISGAYRKEREHREHAELQTEAARLAGEEAVRERDTANRHLYLSDTLLGHQDWEAGQITRLWELLDRHFPASGRPDLQAGSGTTCCPFATRIC